MSNEIHQPCPYPSCGSSDAFSYNQELRIGKCHACGEGYPSKLPMFPWAREAYPMPEKKVDVTQLPVASVTYEGIRSIDPEVCKIYGIQLQLDAEGKPVRYAFKHKNNTKYRGYDEKKFWTKDRGVPMDDLFGPDFNAGGKRLYLTEGECFLPDTEVLTPEGWKALSSLSDTDRVMQVTAGGSGSFTDTTAIIDKQYSGDLIEYRSGSYYSLTTEGHKLVRLSDAGLKKFSATTHKHLPIPRTTVSDSIKPTLTADQMRVWIMLSADFTFREKGDIYGCFSKVRKIERVRTLLDKLNVRYSDTVDVRGMQSFFIHRGHSLPWAKKELPTELLTHPDKEDLLREIVFWDGNHVRGRNQAEFATKLKYNADLVQALCHVCGYTSTIMPRTNQFGSWFKLSILWGKQTSSTQKGYSRVPYSGRVMCVTVPSGMILVRQKGSVSVSGNCDAASLYQVLGKTYPVLSIPSASIGEKFLKKNYDYLNSFSEIAYAGELDDAGRKAAEKIYAAFPSKFFYVPLTKWKDANEFLENGDGDALKWAALKPQRYSPENFYVSLDRFQKLLKEETPYEFVPTPCVALNDLIQGHTKGGMTLYKAYPGSGKTTLFRYFQYDLLKNTDQKIAVLHLEESKSTTLRGLASYELGKNVNTKVSAAENGVTEDQIQACLSSFIKDDNLILFEFTPSDYSDIFEACLRYVRMAITAYGANYIFLDHVQRLAYMAGVEDATRNLTTFAVKVEDICREFNVGFNAISHLNNEGAAKYAKSLEESCIISIDLTRDKESEDEVEQNTIRLAIPGKNRPWAKLGEAGKLFYNQDTTLLEELQD